MTPLLLGVLGLGHDLRGAGVELTGVCQGFAFSKDFVESLDDRVGQALLALETFDRLMGCAFWGDFDNDFKHETPLKMWHRISGRRIVAGYCRF